MANVWFLQRMYKFSNRQVSRITEKTDGQEGIVAMYCYVRARRLRKSCHFSSTTSFPGPFLWLGSGAPKQGRRPWERVCFIQLEGNETKTNLDWLAHVFPRFASIISMHLLRVLIDSLDCLCPSWLAGVFVLALVLRLKKTARDTEKTMWEFLFFQGTLKTYWNPNELRRKDFPKFIDKREMILAAAVINKTFSCD